MSKPQKGQAPKGRSKWTKSKRREDDEYGYATRNQPLQKPADQENLTDQQLKEEFIRTLTSLDPLKPKNLAIWDYAEGTFVPYVDLDHFVVTYSMESELLDKDGEEIREYSGDLIDDVSDIEEDHTKKTEETTSKGAPSLHHEEKKKDEDDAEEKEERDEPPPPPTGKPKKMLNQFNFCERASQTDHNKLRDHQVQTENPSRAQYRDMCNQWIIYDAYQSDKLNRPVASKHDKAGGAGGEEEEHEESPGSAEGHGHGHEHEEKGKDKKVDKEKKGGKEHKIGDSSGRIAEREKVKTRKQSAVEGQAAMDLALLKAVDGLRFMERLVATNVFDDVLEDFKYFEDAADEYREAGDGTLLPLWKYSYDRAKKMHATCISWSQSQPDMFAVSYGSFSFVHPVQTGMVVVYTLRNTSFPEFAWSAPKGAMTCHVHPQRNCLVAVGLYDGNVAILNLEKDEENETRTEVLKNIPTVMKHRAAVWSVKWGPDDIDGNPTFYSAGMDGRIIQWVLGVPDMQGIGGLEGTALSCLYLPMPSVTGPDGTTYKLFGCARVLAFHPKQKNSFLVGTAEGKIFRCSALYGSRFQEIYNAHFLPVAALQWNHYHDDVFISCSEDWTIKIWDQRDTKPMYIYEIGVPILDVCWAPYSSTVFAACTDEGKVLVYDINVNKEKPVCSQQVVTKRKIHPHRVQFNPVYPIIVVGDDRGTLTTLKMSPNLRILPRDTRNILLDGEVRIKFEINKMAKLLSLVRDPLTVTSPDNIPGPSGKNGPGGDGKQNNMNQ